MTTGRKITLAAAALLALLVLTLFGSHYYLRWTAARYRAELIRKGERLRIDELLPKRPPDEDNGVPDLKAAMVQLPPYPSHPIFSYSPPLAMSLLSPGRALVGWKQPDLRASGRDKTNTWEELASELEQLAPVLEQIRGALQKPAFDFNLNYSEGMSLRLPHIGELSNAGRALSSCTLLTLHDGHLLLAITNLWAQLALVRVLEHEPLPVSQLIRAGLTFLALQATWEALQADGWSDAQLSDLQERWQTLRFLDRVGESLPMARAMALRGVDQVRQSDTLFQQYFGRTTSGSMIVSSSDPLDAIEKTTGAAMAGLEGFFWRTVLSYSDERRYLGMEQVMIETFRAPAEARVYSVDQRQIRKGFIGLGCAEELLDGAEVTQRREGFRYFISNVAINSLQLNTRSFIAETERELAVAAIALKRYQLRNGQPPPRLEALVEAFLTRVPRDYMDGKPLRYRTNATSGFVLYSVGPDGIDNGGDASPTNAAAATNGPVNWLLGRDLVWPQPAS